MHIIAMGDFNADCNSLLFKQESPRQSQFGNTVWNFCDDENLVMCDVVHFQEKHSVHTFESEPHNSVSWIDHCISIASAADLISDLFKE